MNVHKFDVGNSRYVYPNGRDVQWERDGITLAEVDCASAASFRSSARRAASPPRTAATTR